MKKTLVISVLVLIVFPTAILSLLAGFSLRHWEVVLHQRLESNAATVLATAAMRVQTFLDGEVEQARAALVSSIGSGIPSKNISAVARQFEAAHPLAETVYVFMDPWGFIWPEEGERVEGTEASGQGGAIRASLTAALRHEIASARSLLTPLMVTAESDTYCFKRLELRSDVYAGFSINPESLRLDLSRILNDLSGDDFKLRATGPGLQREAALVVHDSLSPGTSDTLQLDDHTPALAELRLNPPFDHIVLSACPTHPAPTSRAGLTQARLSTWGILLLAVGVLSGIGIVLYEVSHEIRVARSRSDFVVGISHDLRTPITSVRLMAESLHLGYVVDPEKQKTFLKAMVQESERLSQLIERVLYFVRFGQKALQFRMTSLSMQDVVHESVRTFATTRLGADEPEAGPTGGPGEPPGSSDTRVIQISKLMTLQLRIEPRLPGVQGDAGALQQVILNLLDNAEKYGCATPETGPVTVEIAITHGQRSSIRNRPMHGVSVSVTDHGMGIARREQRKIFRQFYRSARARQGHASGVGLGLALCRYIVRVHGGSLSVHSAIGKGSTFTIRLPAEESNAASGKKRP